MLLPCNITDNNPHADRVVNEKGEPEKLCEEARQIASELAPSLQSAASARRARLTSADVDGRTCVCMVSQFGQTLLCTVVGCIAAESVLRETWLARNAANLEHKGQRESARVRNSQ